MARENSLRLSIILKENGFNTHQQWLRANRDKKAFYVGSKEESGANQQFQVSYNSQTGSFSFKIRKDFYVKDKKKRYLTLEGIRFNHLRDYFKKAVEAKSGQGAIPLSYRIKKRGRK